MTGHGEPTPLRDFFSGTAGGYARYRPTYPDDVIRALAALAPRRGLVWEAGCGSGQLTSRLATAFTRIVASDASAAQIATAPRAPQIRYVVERAEMSTLGDRTADLCVAAQAAHWFDLDHYYAEVGRIGTRNSRIALLTYGGVVAMPDIDDLCREFGTGTLRRHWPAERMHVDEGYRTLPFPFPGIEAPAFQLRQSWTLDQFLGYMATWSAVRELVRSDGPAPFHDFASRLRSLWGPVERTREFRWPLTLRIGVIHGGSAP